MSNGISLHSNSLTWVQKKEKELHTVISRYKIAGYKIDSELTCVSRSSRGVNMKNCKGLAK